MALSEVFEPEDAASGVAEFSYGEVDVSVAVEVTGLDVCDAACGFEQDVSVVAVAVSFEQEDSSDVAVVGKGVAEDGDEDVEVTVCVDIDDGGVGRCGHVRADCVFGPGVVVGAVVGDQAVGEGVAGEDFGLKVAVEIDDLDVAESGRDWAWWIES